MKKIGIQPQLLINTASNLVGVVGTGILGYLFHFATSREMEVSGYGELQALVALFSIFSVLTNLIANFVLKFSAIFAGHKDFSATVSFYQDILSRLAKSSLMPLIAIVFSAPFLYKVFDFSDSFGVVVVGFGLYTTILMVIPHNVLTGWQMFLPVQSTALFVAMGKLIIGYGLAAFGLSASFVVLSYAIPNLLGFFILHKIFQRKFHKTKSEFSQTWKDKHFSMDYFKKSLLPIGIFSSMVVLINNQEVLLVKYFTSPDMTGYFSAFIILGKLVFWINGAIIGLILPMAIADSHTKGKTNAIVTFATYAFIAVSCGITIAVFYFYPQLLVGLFFGERYTAGVDDLYLFGIFGLFLSLLMLEANLAFARHNFTISYVLGLVAIGQIVLISLYHETTAEIILGINASLAVGYLASLAVNYLPFFGRFRRA